MTVRIGTTYYEVRYQPVAAIVGAALLVTGLFSMIYTVQAESQGIILRFGRYSKTVEPGLHFKFPFAIDQVQMVPIRRQLKQEFGFGTPGSSNPSQYTDRDNQEAERSMVTGDLNAATVEWIIQYRITDPRAYLFHFREPAETLRDLSESVMREMVGDRTVDEVITVGRQEIEGEALSRLQTIIATKRYQLGFVVDQVQLKNVNPPPPVQPSFNEVNQAQQEREKSINMANGEYNKAVPRARGEAQEKISTAEGYAVKRVNEAQGDALRFQALLTEYLKAPAVTHRRIYLEALGEVLPQLGPKIILDEEARQFLPLLQLNPAIKRP